MAARWAAMTAGKKIADAAELVVGQTQTIISVRPHLNGSWWPHRFVAVSRRASIGALPERAAARDGGDPRRTLAARRRQAGAQQGTLGRLREVAARAVGEGADDLLGRNRTSTVAAAEAPERGWRSVWLLECDRDPPGKAKAFSVPPGERGTVGSWTTRRAPPSRSADHIAVPSFARGTAARSQVVRAGSSATSAATRRSTLSWTRSTHETSATVSTASTQSMSSPGGAAARGDGTKGHRHGCAAPVGTGAILSVYASAPTMARPCPIAG